jgi:hypothetical protein
MTNRRSNWSPNVEASFQDNAASHKVAITHQKVADLHFEALKHPVYSPGLGPSYYCPLPDTKKRLKGTIAYEH